MGKAQPYTIHFNYEIVEDSVKFPLQATVTAMPDKTYLIDNIRHTGEPSGSLVPTISLTRHRGSWIYTHGKNETPLSVSIGKAIDKYEQSASSL